LGPRSSARANQAAAALDCRSPGPEGLSETFSQYKPNAVFQLAAHHDIPFCEENPAAAYDLNVCGTLSVLSEASKSEVDGVFFASTADVYVPSPRPHTEDDAPGPFSTYGRTQLIGEMIRGGIADWGWRPHLLVGRIFNAVGPRETNPSKEYGRSSEVMVR
jgi:UDP-glucose 4-epimerase